MKQTKWLKYFSFLIKYSLMVLIMNQKLYISIFTHIFSNSNNKYIFKFKILKAPKQLIFNIYFHCSYISMCVFVDWPTLMACQRMWGYFMPRGYRTTLIVCFYWYFFCISSFFAQLCGYQVFLSNTNHF